MRESFSGARRAMRPILGASGTCSSSTRMPRPAASPTAATKYIVQRQSPSPPSTVPIGEPSAVAAVRPATITAIAWPRRFGSTMLAPVPVAVGEYMAAPSPANTREASASAKVGASAVARFASTKMPRPASISRLRGTLPAMAAMVGASSA